MGSIELVTNGSWIQFTLLLLKETASVISRDHLCKDGNVPFTTIPMKSWYDQKCGGHPCSSDSKSVLFLCVSPLLLINMKWASHLSWEIANENKSV